MPRKHKERGKICPYQSPNDAKKNQHAWEPTILEQGVGTSGNPEIRTMKEGGWETLNSAGRNQFTWEKRRRERQSKVEFEKMESRRETQG